ncbi:Eco57I restriction-modification methylase domain-containing protein [Actinomycetospora sp. CA-053990]|uniref:Eco57I restriction-modification methylase domain-containing protein n=1 Tax=Actinomycetospora sp. CA-053990 TaxID=3239891 RepID=UPI003D91E8CF
MTAWFEDFLPELEPRRWNLPSVSQQGFAPQDVFLQAADYGLEVATATSANHPNKNNLRALWKARQGGRPAPVLLVVGYEERGATKLAVCGPAGDEPPVHTGLGLDQVERIASAALSEPNRHAAQRCLFRLLTEIDSELPGLVNSGLLATQELRKGVPAREDWEESRRQARPKLKFRGRPLIESLGFSIDNLSTNTSLLKVGDDRRAVAVLLDEGEAFDAPGARFDGVSPVSHALAVADREHLSWVILTRAAEIRLYAVKTDTGVGRKGRASTFIEANLALLPEELGGYLPLLFSADALADGGTFEQILDRSADFAADVATRLRERVYGRVIPFLARAVATRLSAVPTEDDLSAAYERTLVILFRLLFVAYGEDKDLLPYRTNSRYADHSLKRIARRLSEDAHSESGAQFDPDAIDFWEDVAQLWRAVDKGNKSWGVPPYNGGLFSADPDVSESGTALADLTLTDSEFGPALLALLVDVNEEGAGPVDFRSLSVREFGTIYEGLLEAQLSVAPTDLTVDSKGNFEKARTERDVVVRAGEVYLHNKSGARKSSGSYFTKPFAVEHLLDNSLERSIKDHIARVSVLLDEGDEAAAATAFFDFRCADISMGSGHFLVAAIDRIEARLSDFLALRPIPAVTAELEQLRDASRAALGDLSNSVEVETTSLLRRQVARRCIYGVDRNRISVELARLAIWIHTFVPGLPLSFLDHNLVQGDSLTGVGSIDDALQALTGGDPDAPTLFREQITEFLSRTSAALRRLATTADATLADVKASADAHQEALEKAGTATALFDLIVSHRVGDTHLPVDVDEDTVLNRWRASNAAATASELRSLHLPVAFPEVFLRERPGFDCILGNPPWEKVKVEEHGFWSLRYPGLKSLTQQQRAEEIRNLRIDRPDLEDEFQSELSTVNRVKRLFFSGPYKGMGTGDPDLYKAFCWRFWEACRQGTGTIGVVLPRSALTSSGTQLWRLAVLNSGAFEDATLLLNSRGWAFDDADPRYTMSLTSLRKSQTEDSRVSFRGPFSSYADFQHGVLKERVSVVASDFLTWSDEAAFPALPSADAANLFLKIRSHPRLDATERRRRVRPTRELHASDDKTFFLPIDSDRGWPVYKGESIETFDGDTGAYLARAEPDAVLPYLQKKRVRQQRTKRSAFSEFSAAWAADQTSLPCLRPRITFRDISRSTDTRTVIAALAPPHVFLTHLDPYLLWPGGVDEASEAYLLGVLNSMPLDWYARRWVENHVSYGFLNSLPIPDPEEDDPVRKRVAEIGARLSVPDSRFQEWANRLGVVIGAVEEPERSALTAELDACVAVLYGLNEDDLRNIYTTFHYGADYSQHHGSVLGYFRGMCDER